MLKNGGLLSFLGHEYEFQAKHYKNCLNGKKFYAYADIYWESFNLEELKTFADKAGFPSFFAKKVLFTLGWMERFCIACVKTRQNNTVYIGGNYVRQGQVGSYSERRS